jgi:hypothetical protein
MQQRRVVCEATPTKHGCMQACPPHALHVVAVSTMRALQDRAAEYIAGIKASPEVWKLCCERFGASQYAEVRFWCLQTLHEVRAAGMCPCRWRDWQQVGHGRLMVHSWRWRLQCGCVDATLHVGADGLAWCGAACTPAAAAPATHSQLITACYGQLDGGAKQMVREANRRVHLLLCFTGGASLACVHPLVACATHTHRASHSRPVPAY